MGKTETTVKVQAWGNAAGLCSGSGRGKAAVQLSGVPGS